MTSPSDMTTPQIPGSPSSAVGEREALKPCPFCGGNNLELSNTHTPIFWVECEDCGAQKDGEYFESPRKRDSRFSYVKEKPCSSFEADYGNLWPEYRDAVDSAIAAWNRRAAISAPAAEQQAGVPGDYSNILEGIAERGAGKLDEQERGHLMDLAAALRELPRPPLSAVIPADLLGKIVDEVFDGAIEDDSPIREIYAVIAAHRAQQAGAGLGEAVIRIDQPGTYACQPCAQPIWLVSIDEQRGIPHGALLYTADALRAKVEPSDEQVYALAKRIADEHADWSVAKFGVQFTGPELLTFVKALQGAKLADAQAPSDQEMIEAAYRITGAPQGLPKAVAFNHGARWMRERLAAAPIEAQAQKGGDRG